MKALCNIFKTGSASDEFKSTFKVFKMSPSRPHAERPEVCRSLMTSRRGSDSLACLSLFLCGVCMMSVLCFVFVFDGNKLKSGFKSSYYENTFRISFQSV